MNEQGEGRVVRIAATRALTRLEEGHDPEAVARQLIASLAPPGSRVVVLSEEEARAAVPALEGFAAFEVPNEHHTSHPTFTAAQSIRTALESSS